MHVRSVFCVDEDYCVRCFGYNLCEVSGSISISVVFVIVVLAMKCRSYIYPVVQ